MDVNDYFTSLIHPPPGVDGPPQPVKKPAQQRLILDYLEEYSHLGFTVSQIMRALIKHRLLPKDVLVTSVRRAVSDLHRHGKIEKQALKVRGPHGAPETVWQFREETEQEKVLKNKFEE